MKGPELRSHQLPGKGLMAPDHLLRSAGLTPSLLGLSFHVSFSEGLSCPHSVKPRPETDDDRAVIADPACLVDLMIPPSLSCVTLDTSHSLSGLPFSHMQSEVGHASSHVAGGREDPASLHTRKGAWHPCL